MKFKKYFASAVLALSLSTQVFAGNVVSFSGPSAVDLMQAFRNSGINEDPLRILSLTCTMSVTSHPEARCIVFKRRGDRVSINEHESKMIMDILASKGGQVSTGHGVTRVSVRNLRCFVEQERCFFYKLTI
jgi:hypothetical protein